jgi:hemoglobin
MYAGRAMNRVVIALLLAGCATTSVPVESPPAGEGAAFTEEPSTGTAPADKPSLHQRLGGEPAIAAVVDDFMGRVARDERINVRFINSDLPRLRGHLIAFVCAAAGGPCKYTGKDMKTAHVGMMISDAEYDALVEALKGALDHLKVPAPEQGELLGALGPLRPEIVEPQPKGPPPGAEAVRNAVGERVRALREGAVLLEKAAASYVRGNLTLADQLFSAAELVTGPDAVTELGALFRAGAPPRVTSRPTRVAADAPPQPGAVGSSDEEQPALPRRKEQGSLRGDIKVEGGAALNGFAVVTLEPLSGRFSKRVPKRRVIEQRDREFAPKVLAVPVGSTVSFPNFDPIYHNVFSRSPARPFDLGLYRSGLTRELTFDREGIVRVGCNLHANMAAFVVVVKAPHYVVTDQQGRFNFASVTPGRYRVQTYREGSDKPVVQAVEIKARDNQIALTVPAAAAQGALENKFGAPRGGTAN